jgi:beta-lactamase class D
MRHKVRECLSHKDADGKEKVYEEWMQDKGGETVCVRMHVHVYEENNHELMRKKAKAKAARRKMQRHGTR